MLDREHTDLRVIVNIGAQRAFLVKDGQIAFETPISTGRGPRMTPRGTFKITEKIRTGKISTIYKCPLPGWMRVGEMPIGMHEGELPGYPASHGCIRMPLESAHFIFDRAPVGTTVQIVDSWSPPAAGTATRWWPPPTKRLQPSLSPSPTPSTRKGFFVFRDHRLEDERQKT